MKFKIKTKFRPAGDQPKAIKKLVQGLKKNYEYQTLLGVTGSGKTFTIANVIEQYQKPVLVIAQNKTLTAQLCNELRDFFPNNAVEYFVSYYDYYQPEAYLPATDTYIEKEAQINDEIDRLRHSATQALLSRQDVIVVASVSCIYGLGSPQHYLDVVINPQAGEKLNRQKFLRKLVDLGYVRTNSQVKRGYFRSRGPIIEIMPISDELIYRIELKQNTIDQILAIHPVSRKTLEKTTGIWIFPARHFVTPDKKQKRALKAIRRELNQQIKKFKKQGKLLEAQRIKRRTNYDLEMIQQIGYCTGIENYSRHLDYRKSGEPAETLLSYFPENFITIIDESHVTVPQIRGMYAGDKARKNSLIENGFRLPSAKDNRPLKFNEFLDQTNQIIFTSATPADWECKKSAQIVEQIIRPTGLVDPKIKIRPIMDQKAKSQIDDLIIEIKKRAKKKERVLVTTLTKKQAEDLSAFLHEKGIQAKYLHSDIETLDRIRLLIKFRKGEFDCLVGVNLLREGLDLPEVTLVAILDADKEGFLRSETSLIQTIGRAARNVQGKIILYADEITGSIKRAVAETNRRRKKQLAYNKKHNITPQTIHKKIQDITKIWGIKEKKAKKVLSLEMSPKTKNKLSKTNIKKLIKQKQHEMRSAAKKLEFELAAVLRDEVKALKKIVKDS